MGYPRAFHAREINCATTTRHSELPFMRRSLMIGYEYVCVCMCVCTHVCICMCMCICMICENVSEKDDSSFPEMRTFPRKTIYNCLLN